MKKLFVTLVMSMFMVSFAANASTTNLNNLNISTIVQEDEQADSYNEGQLMNPSP